MPKTVGVAVSNATFHFDKLYTYAVMPDQQDTVRLGSMVLVPFGRGSRARMGVVLACDAEPESAKLKFLFDVAPASACLTPELLRLVYFLKERTFCTYYEAVKAVIPYGAQYKPTVAADGVTPVLQKQLVRHTENSYRLAGTLPQKPKPTAKQLAAVALLGGGPRTLTELEEKGISRAVLDNLCTKGVLECSKVNKSIDLYSSIPLKNEPILLTEEQQAAYNALLPGLEDAAPHSALLYGVTGSGKTLVAAAAIWACIRAGYQAALLAPTEILATQHAEGLNRMLAPFGMRVALLTGGMKAAARRTTLAAIRSDEADLVVGTHAILSEGVEFARLGLAVVDEQHRFGVRQRGMLAEKAANPHLLVMSATPIPRTLGLLIYGDLDISILDELPPGRKPVKTRCITGKKRRDLYGFLDREIGAGRQVYIVCPAIEDTPDGGLNAVKSYYEDIAKALLPDRRVGLMHGKLKPKEKAAVMDDFKAGRLDALVSTTVIEVGVDVPNATVMVIENAERYGLSALHQLRGRVGRGAAESWCFLVSDNTAESVQKRLKFLCSTSDGFAVAQFDLETRGPGDFFGSRQHGLPTLQIADLMNDTRTLHAAQAEAAALLAADPLLEAPEHSLLAAQVEQMFTKAGAMN